jgi:hypothetical protein
MNVGGNKGTLVQRVVEASRDTEPMPEASAFACIVALFLRFGEAFFA